MKNHRDDTEEPYGIEYEENELPKRRGFFAHLFDPLPEDAETPELQPEYIREEARKAARKAARKERKKQLKAQDDAFSELDETDELDELFPDEEEPAERPKKKRKPRPVEETDETDELDELFPDEEEPAERPKKKRKPRPVEESDETDELDELFPDEAMTEPEPDGGEAADKEADAPAETPKTEAETETAEDGAPPAEEAEAPGEAEDIRLFDDAEDADTAERRKKRETRTRIFRTGSETATRIHLNDTEETVRKREAERKAQLRAIAEQKEAEAERRSKRAKRRSVVKKLFSNVAFVLFFIMAVAVALYYGFLLNNIIVLGNENYSAEYIEELSGLKRGTHMLLCDLDGAKKKISEDPYLQVEQLGYIFPNRIRIIVSERKEVAGIIDLNYNVIIDKNGYVLSMSGGTDISGLLQVSGVKMTGFELGQRLGQGDDFTTASLIAIIDVLESHGLTESIKAIDLSTPLAITLRARNGLTVHLGQPTELDEKMTSLEKLLPQFLKQNITTGVLYLSAKGGTVYSPSGADQLALARKQAEALAAEQAQMQASMTGEGVIDDNGDGIDDVTGEEIVIATPEPDTTPTPPPTPTPKLPGGSEDDFSG